MRRAHVTFAHRPFVRACDSSTTRFPRYSGGKLTSAARVNRCPRKRFWTRDLPLSHKRTTVSLSTPRTTGVLPRARQRATKTVPSWSSSGRRRRRAESLRQGMEIYRPRPASSARLIAWRGQGVRVYARGRGFASCSDGGLWFNTMRDTMTQWDHVWYIRSSLKRANVLGDSHTHPPKRFRPMFFLVVLFFSWLRVLSVGACTSTYGTWSFLRPGHALKTRPCHACSFSV